MSREETLNLMLNNVIETMEDLYSRAGISEEDKTAYMQQGNESFKVISINIYEKLVEKGIIVND
jgi:hypothetical protein